MCKNNYDPDTIDVALALTLKMLARGKSIKYDGSVMYVSNGKTYINKESVGDVVDATFAWFKKYSKADPCKGNYGKSQSSIDFLKRRYA